MAIDVERLTQLINKLDQIIQKNSYAGYDPFDGLRSALLKIVPLPGVYPKIAWIQFFKKFPINLRPLFLIAKGINPKAMGLFLSGYSSLYKIHKDNHDLEKAQFITNWLIKNQAPGYSGACWGYNFDWQNRAFFIPKNTPTIVGSAFIGHALLDFYEITGEQGPLATAQSITEFMRHDLFLSQMENDTRCFSYTPLDKTRVHNANLLGAGFLARMHTYVPNDDMLELAQKAARYTLQNQHDSGSWYYAETSIQKWIDSFHTGYNLRSLQYIYYATKEACYDDAIAKGLSFFLNNFICDDGCVKYYHENKHPIDIHCFAEALMTCAVFFENGGCKSAIPKIFSFLEKYMLDPKGYYYYRYGRLSANKIHYIRWSTAWMFYSLTRVLSALSSEKNT